MKTTMAKAGDIQQQWYVIDGTNQVLGRLATQIAKILQGKNKPIYTPHVDTGDFVIVTNVDKIRLTGNKSLQKQYFRYTGFIGGLKVTSYEDMKENHPTDIMKLAVKRMMPKTKLGRKQMKKLKLFVGAEHTHGAQQPVAIDPVKKVGKGK